MTACWHGVINYWYALNSAGYWRHGFSIQAFIKALLTTFGTLWLLTEIVSYFPSFEPLPSDLKKHWWVFFIAGIVLALWDNRPRLSFSCTLKHCDVRIAIRVGNIFDGQHSLVIGCNTSFDTDMQSDIISPKSIQGQYTNRYYDSVPKLDADIATALVGHTPVATVKKGKVECYPVGTTVKVRSQKRTAYFCGFAHMNTHGNAQASFEDLKEALPKLWDHISSAGDHGDISVPLMGAGYARIPIDRESLIREILKSFIAACAAQRPCNSLTVVVSPMDFAQYNVNLAELGSFLTHTCRYTDFRGPTQAGLGQPVP